MCKKAFCYEKKAARDTGVDLTTLVVDGVYPLMLLNGSTEQGDWQWLRHACLLSLFQGWCLTKLSPKRKLQMMWAYFTVFPHYISNHHFVLCSCYVWSGKTVRISCFPY